MATCGVKLPDLSTALGVDRARTSVMGLAAPWWPMRGLIFGRLDARSLLMRAADHHRFGLRKYRVADDRTNRKSHLTKAVFQKWQKRTLAEI